jgi:hypothetical protein
MYFIPLSHEESVQLVIHALRMAGGEADCSGCPASHVCMKQCLSIADAVARMFESGKLPFTSFEQKPGKTADKDEEKDGKVEKAGNKPGLKIIK